MHNDLNTPGRRSTASARPAPDEPAGCHARPGTACAWHPSRNPARRPALRSVPLLSAISLHPFLAAGVKRNSVPWAPKLKRDVSRARARIPLTFLQSIITSGSVRYLFGLDKCALWCRCRERISRRQMSTIWRRMAFTSASARQRLGYRLPRRRRFWVFPNRTSTACTGPVGLGRCRFASAGPSAGRARNSSIGLRQVVHPGAVGWRCARPTIEAMQRPQGGRKLFCPAQTGV
jgi:hypothetical protein